ncbi:unnamed protein product [Prunus armeniaca]
MESGMSSNRMFVLLAESQPRESTCFNTVTEDQTHLWHCRYGHLNFQGLKTLQQNQMVKELPQLKTPSKVCKDCLVGKQHRDSFPTMSTWRASQILQLVHADICGPVTPISNRKKSMLSEKKISKIFWPEAVNWTVHVLNRSPTFAVKNQTPEEAWSGVKPTVDYFKVFGCVSHVHVPDSKRTKLDDKSLRCVLLGVSEESKAYRLYDPVSQKILSGVTMTKKATRVAENEEEGAADLDNEGAVDFNNAAGEEMGNSSSYELVEENPTNFNEGRNRRPPVWMEDYETGEGLFEEDDVAHFVMLPAADPVHFEDAVKSEKWRKAMDSEIKAIEKNDTWELELSAGGKKI